MFSFVRYPGVFCAAALIILSSCAEINVNRRLNDIETYIDSRPDSALAALRSIDTLSLTSPRSRAKYSLLSAIAYDKNYIDTTDVRVIEPAVKYYYRVSDKTHLAKAYYYKGKMFEVAGDMEGAANYYSFAYDLTKPSNNYNTKGLVCAALSRIYSYNRNSKQELFFAQEAEESFIMDGDEKNAWIMQSIVPMCYANTYQWEVADSLYDAFFKKEILDTTVYANALFKAGKTKVRKNKEEPAVACELYQKSIDMGKNPTVDDFSVHVYAMELSGDKEGVNAYLPVLDQLKTNPKNASYVNLWEYRIYKHRQEYEKALSCFEGSIASQDSILIAILGQSLEKVQKDYYIEKSSRLSAENKAQKLIFAFAILAFFVILTLLVVLIHRRKQAWIKKRDEAESLRNDLGLLLAKAASDGESLNRLQSDYVSLFKEQYLALEDLCSAYWSPSRMRSNERILNTAIIAIKSVSEGGRLEATIDSHFDGLMSKLRKDLPALGETTYRMIGFFIAGFSGKTIASILNVSVGTVYTTKNRVKKHIEALDSPYKELYLKLIV